MHESSLRSTVRGADCRRGGPPQGTSLMSTPTRKSRKLLDEGKLRKVSGQLFGEGGRNTTPASSLSGVRRSSRLATISQVGDQSTGARAPPVQGGVDADVECATRGTTSFRCDGCFRIAYICPLAFARGAFVAHRLFVANVVFRDTSSPQ